MAAGGCVGCRNDRGSCWKQCRSDHQGHGKVVRVLSCFQSMHGLWSPDLTKDVSYT